MEAALRSAEDTLAGVLALDDQMTDGVIDRLSSLRRYVASMASGLPLTLRGSGRRMVLSLPSCP